MKNNLLHQIGMTTMELMMGMVISGVVGLGVAKILKSTVSMQKEAEQRANVSTLEKMFEASMNSRGGCATLVGKKIGDPMTLKVANMNMAPGFEVQGTKIVTLNIVGFTPSNTTDTQGITKITMVMETAGKRIRREVPMMVSIVNSGSDKVIESCVMSDTGVIDNIVSIVCSDTYGPLTDGKTCAEAVTIIRRELVDEICTDLNQGTPGQVEFESCVMKVLHAEQTCGIGNLVSGFDMNGNILCNGAPVIPPIPPKVCSSFTSWAPEQNTVCVGLSLDQYRDCNDGVVTLKESRTATGTKTGCGEVACNITYQARNDRGMSPQNTNGGWSLYKNGADRDCDDFGCGIMMGLSCTGDNRVRLIYSYQEASSPSMEITTPWSFTDGTSISGGWALSRTTVRDECEGARQCGLRVRAETEMPATCTVKYQYKNENRTSVENQDGNWSVVSNVGGADENCDDGTGCGIRATINCTVP